MSIDTAAPGRERGIGRIEFRGALVTAEAFLAMAGLCFVSAVLMLIVAVGEHQVAAVFGAIWCLAGAMSSAFFGYVLKILVGIFEQTWETRFSYSDED